MNKGQVFFRNHAVALVDILGQKELLSKFYSFPETEAQREELLEQLRETVGVVQDLRKNFKEQFEIAAQERPLPKILNPEVHERFHLCQKKELHLQTFSDTIVAWTPICPESDVEFSQAISSVFSIIHTVAMLQPLYLASGHPLRGGIEVDLALQMAPDSHEIYGKALTTAYALESKVAKYPRVLIGPGLMSFLHTVLDIKNQINSAEALVASKIAQVCLDFTTRDTDGEMMVHYLGTGFRQIALSGNYQEFFKVLSQSRQEAQKSLERFFENEKLRPRYEMLCAYFNRFFPEWPEPDKLNSI